MAGLAGSRAFDAIIVTAAPPEIPAALMAQLDEGGVLVLPVGEEHQYLKRIRRRGGEFFIDTVEAVRFVPLVRGTGLNPDYSVLPKFRRRVDTFSVSAGRCPVSKILAVNIFGDK